MKITANDIALRHEPITDETFVRLYVAVRDKEGRLYTDEQLARLPDIDAMHMHYREWGIRKRSCRRMLNYLENKKRPLSILETGCGNGWLSAKLAGLPRSRVTGLDLNRAEIEQARRVFTHANLEFIHQRFEQYAPQCRAKFDIILFAASLQYFPSLRTVLTAALGLLNPGGEIHLLDTRFYGEQELEASAGRSERYYEALGFAGMAGHYFHHSLRHLKGFRYKILYDPRNLVNRLSRQGDFCWIMLQS